MNLSRYRQLFRAQLQQWSAQCQMDGRKPVVLVCFDHYHWGMDAVVYEAAGVCRADVVRVLRQALEELEAQGG